MKISFLVIEETVIKKTEEDDEKKPRKCEQIKFYDGC